MGGLGLLPLLAALGIHASLGARRFARPSAAVVTVGDDSVLHAERADRGRFADRHVRVLNRPRQELTERGADRLRGLPAEGAVTSGSWCTPMRPPVAGHTGAEGFL